MRNISKVSIILIIIFIAIFVFQPIYNANAALVTCGRAQDDPNTKDVDESKPCQTCDLFVLASSIINFILFTITPAVAVLFYLIAGFMVLLGGANPGLVATGRNIFKTTTYGLFIIFGSWMITNTVLKSIAGDPQFTQDWYKVTCTNPTGSAGGGGVATGGGTSGGSGAGSGGGASTGGESSTLTCMFSGVDLCQGKSTACSNSSCTNQYAASAKKYESGAATANVLKAIMFAESSCNVNAVSFDNPPTSFGLMQLRPDTANQNSRGCPIQNNAASCTNAGGSWSGTRCLATRAWLTNPANADASICIGANFINTIAAGTCGSQVRNIYAGYNGGSSAAGACSASNDCPPPQKSCDGSNVRKWECLYDRDSAGNLVCNGDSDIKLGYNQTKAGATKIIYCNANPGF